MVIIHDESAYTGSSTQDHLVNMDKLPDEGIPNVSHPIDDLKVSDAIRNILRSHLIFGHIGSRALTSSNYCRCVITRRESPRQEVCPCSPSDLESNFLYMLIHRELSPCDKVYQSEVM